MKVFVAFMSISLLIGLFREISIGRLSGYAYFLVRSLLENDLFFLDGLLIRRLIIMRFEIGFIMDWLRCMKPLLLSTLKLCFSNETKSKCYLLYFIQRKQVRLLIDSGASAFIFAFDPKIFKYDESQLNIENEILVISILDGQSLLKGLLEFIENSSLTELRLNLSREKSDKTQEPFRSLNISSDTTQIRIEVARPIYDDQELTSHEWISGCGSSDNSKVTFLLEVEHLLNALRLFVRGKKFHEKEKIVHLALHFQTNKFEVYFDHSEIRCQGFMKDVVFSAQKYEADYMFIIPSLHAPSLYEAIGKCMEIKCIITRENQIALCYSKELAYEAQLLIRDWLIVGDIVPHHPPELKMEHM